MKKKDYIVTYPVGLNKGEEVWRHNSWDRSRDVIVIPDGQFPSEVALNFSPKNK